MRRRTRIDPGFPFGCFIASPLTVDSIATVGLYLLYRHLEELEGAQIAAPHRAWLRRALFACFKACRVHPWDVFSWEADDQARALHALECVRRALVKEAGLTEQETPHRWQSNAWSIVAAMPRQRRQAAAIRRRPGNVIAGPWRKQGRPPSPRGQGPKGAA